MKFGKLYQFAKRMRQIGHLVDTRFIASLSKDVLQSLIELVLVLSLCEGPNPRLFKKVGDLANLSKAM
jgi:hypothetical protein